MVFSKRERVVIALTAAALALLVLDRYVVEPFWDARNEAKLRRARLADEMFDANLLLQKSRLMSDKWQEMVASGMKGQREGTESQVLHAVDGWAKEAAIKLSSVVPQERLGATNPLLPEMCFHASGEGNLKAVTGFIWRLETAKFPLKIQSLQIGSQKPGADDLTVQVDFSTLYAPGDSQTPQAGSVQTASTGGEKK
jgi:hypothetical protein